MISHEIWWNAPIIKVNPALIDLGQRSKRVTYSRGVNIRLQVGGIAPGITSSIGVSDPEVTRLRMAKKDKTGSTAPKKVMPTGIAMNMSLRNHQHKTWHNIG